MVPRRGWGELDPPRAGSAGRGGVTDLDRRFGSGQIRLPGGASPSIDDVEVCVGGAVDRRKDAPGEGRPHVVLTGRGVGGSVVIRGPRRSPLRRRVCGGARSGRG